MSSTDGRAPLVAGGQVGTTGTVSRNQALDLGLRPHDLRRLERRRLLVRFLPRVYVDHTGRPSWLQQAWGAVLHAWPAALVAGRGTVRLS